MLQTKFDACLRGFKVVRPCNTYSSSKSKLIFLLLLEVVITKPGRFLCTWISDKCKSLNPINELFKCSTNQHFSVSVILMVNIFAVSELNPELLSGFF